MHYGSDYKSIPAISVQAGAELEVLPDVYCVTLQIVNIAFIGEAGSNEFVLVDAGMPSSAETIMEVAENRFGAGSKPKAIILTHGHFDHVGSTIELIRHWNVPVYAHQLELPFLTGQMNYPEPDASVEGGLLAKLSPMFPNEAIQLGQHIQALPADGTVPHLAGWRWLHTPGHTPGHISLFREQDRTLIAGDAFVTVRQDSLYKVITQEQEVNGPPRYLTTDWAAAKQSVLTLAALKPNVAVTGHGVPMQGVALTEGLQHLAAQFDQLAVPDYGKYVTSGMKH